MKTQLGTALNKARKKKRKSLAQLAGACGCTSQYLSHVERGKNPVSPEVMIEAASALGVPVSRFVRAAVADYRARIEERIAACG